MQKISEPMHSDFVKIYKQFLKRYGVEKGKQYYYAWLNQLGLDDSKPYGGQKKSFEEEKFRWAKSRFQLLKQDKTAKYYQVEALFPLVSMNRNVYTEDELLRAARTLIGKPVNINHRNHVLKGVTIKDAEYEDGAVECLLKVLNRAGHGLGLNIQKMIEDGHIVHVSIEATCKRGQSSTPDGWKCEGLVFTGLALLTKDALPGVPLTRILPVEMIVESFDVPEDDTKMEKEKTEKQKEDEAAEKISGLELQLSKCQREHEEMEEQLTQRNNEIIELRTKIQGLTVEIAQKNRELTELQAENKRLTERVKKAKRLGKIVLKV